MEEPGVVVEAVVECVLYADATGFTVARMATGEQEQLTATGPSLWGVQPGETLRLHGRWTRHRQYGSQLVVTECERVLPAQVHAIRRYLGSGLVRGIGPRLAQAIVDHFAQDTLQVIATTPQRLLEVHHIGPARRDAIVAAWAEQQAIREVMVFLHQAGVSPALATRIHKALGEQTLTVLRKDPYRLAEAVPGIGFVTAETIARAVGIDASDPKRLRAGLLHTLERAQAQGHCHVPQEHVIGQAARLLEAEPAELHQVLDTLRADRKVVVELLAHAGTHRAVVFPTWLHHAEVNLAGDLMRLLKAPSQLPGQARWSHPHTPLAGPGIPAGGLHPDQEQAVRMALTHTVSLLTGGPGCGKSFTVATLVALARSAGATVTLAAPTGRAAQRLAQLTGQPAMTVHRLLRTRTAAKEEGALFGSDDPLQADLIVIDEASMLDVHLAARLARAVPSGCHLLLVGDVDQLPSVGPGSVLRDLLSVPVIARTRLTQVFRQAPGGSLVINAHRIRAGQLPSNGGEFWFVAVERAEDIPDQVLDIALRRLPEKFGLDSGQVQVLCPGRRTAAGALALSRALQARCNPARPDAAQHWVGDRVFRLGDRVMAIRNNYDKGPAGVFNGSYGTVTGVLSDQRRLEVSLEEGTTVGYDFDELDELLHAYAITVHRAQGSEYPYVVVPLTTAAGKGMLQRNLLYTAITRAQKMIVLVGQPEALQMAVRHTGARRNTALARRLADGLAEPAPPPVLSSSGQLACF